MAAVLGNCFNRHQLASMVANPFTPEALVGRQAELYQVSTVLAADGDLLIAGVPGSGRRKLVRQAAQTVAARVIDIDCLRATDSDRFLNLLAEGVLATFGGAAERRLIEQCLVEQPIDLTLDDHSPENQPQLVWSRTTDAWFLFKSLLSLPQAIAEQLNCRVVIVFQNFPHMRSWDRSNLWESYLRQEIQQQSRVSYALIATVAESWVQQSEIQVVFLGPLKPEDLRLWLIEAATTQALAFEPQALTLFLDYVQGNFGDAIALLRRIWSDYFRLEFRLENVDVRSHPNSKENSTSEKRLIQLEQVHQSALALVEDLSLTFESLLLLLPSSQVRVLESLALDPTDMPHAREYIQKHHLSRGGGLQGALASLQQKGLVYGAESGYRLTMPLLALWLKHQLT